MLVRLALSNDALNTKSPTASRIPRAIRCTCSSLSITHGPAMRTSGLPFEKALNSIGTRVLGLPAAVLLEQLGLNAPPVFESRADESLEKRMRLQGLRLELGVKLAAQEPWVVGDLADLDVRLVGRF